MMMVPRKGGQTRATVVKGEVEGESVVMEHSLQSEAGDGETRKSSETAKLEKNIYPTSSDEHISWMFKFKDRFLP